METCYFHNKNNHHQSHLFLSWCPPFCSAESPGERDSCPCFSNFYFIPSKSEPTTGCFQTPGRTEGAAIPDGRAIPGGGGVRSRGRRRAMGGRERISVILGGGWPASPGARPVPGCTEALAGLLEGPTSLPAAQTSR